MNSAANHPKRFLILWGPPSVGKMTIGQALSEQTGLKLFHNHMTIEPLLPIFEFHDPVFQQLKARFRHQICEAVAASDLPGLIFTFVWSLDTPENKHFVDGLTALFRAQGAEIYYAELRGSLATRLQRNGTENRLKHKPSKRDLSASDARLKQASDNHVLNSSDAYPFFYSENTTVIDTESLSPEEAARAIRVAFNW